MNNALIRTVIGVISSLLVTVPAHTSPLFDGTNSNLWLLDENGNITERRIDVSSPNWLTNFLLNGNPVLTLGQGQQALINQVENSSKAPQAGQPPLSLVGLSSGTQATAGVQVASLQIAPNNGRFNETVRIQLKVPSSLTTSGTAELNWTVNGDTEKLLLNEAGLKTLESDKDFLVKSLFLIRNGDYAIQATLVDSGTTISQASANLTLSSTHPDGIRRDTNNNGLPDLVELAIGLNPLDSNWQYDSDNNGWSDFDEWLRADRLGDDGLPLDTDKDGWSDFDEELRQTNPNDPTDVLLKDLSATPLTLAQKNQYRDVPVAGSLYEPEYLVGATLSGGSAGDTWVSTQVNSLTGVQKYDSKELLTPADIAKTTLDPSVIPSYKLFDSVLEKIEQSQPASIRLPAKQSQIVSATFSTPEKPDVEDSEQQYQFNHWLVRKSELTPLYFQQNTQNSQWNTAAEWKAAYIQYLRDNLIVTQAIQPNIDSTLDTVFTSVFISQEAKFQNITDVIIVGTRGATSASRISLSKLESNLADIAEMAELTDSRYTLDTVYGVLKTAREGNNTISALFNTLKSQWSVETPPSIAELISSVSQDPGHAYQIRLYPIPNALLQVALNQDLFNPVLDVDNDNLSNTDELSKPMDQITYPWAADTDKDQLVDGSDACPLDALNLCQAMPPLPKLMISESSTYAEPANGSDAQAFAIISFTLDKKYTEPVLVQYQSADEANGATAGVDYTQVGGTLTIPAGEQVGFLLIPILADGLEEQDERFLLNITQVTGASYNVSEPVVVVIKDTQLDPNAPVINSTPKYRLASGESLSIENSDLLSNASDPNNEALSIGAIVSMPAKGSLTQNANGFVYSSVTEIDNLVASEKADFVTRVAPDYIMYREVDGDQMRFKTYQISTGQTETLRELPASTGEFKGFYTRDDWDGAYFTIPGSSPLGPIVSWTPASNLIGSILSYTVDSLMIDPKTARAYSCMRDGFRSRWFQFYTDAEGRMSRTPISQDRCDPELNTKNFRLNDRFCLIQDYRIYCVKDAAEGVSPGTNALTREGQFLYDAEVADITPLSTPNTQLASVYIDASGEDYRPDMAISGDWLVVYDAFYDHYRGVVKLYQLDNGNWVHHQTLNPRSENYFTGNYGNSALIAGDNLVLVNSTGELEYFRRNASKAQNQWEFVESVVIPVLSAQADLSTFFVPRGVISPDGMTLAVSRFTFSTEDVVYIYKLENNSWTLKQTINEQADSVSFGNGLQLSDNMLLIADPSFKEESRTGRVWAYKLQDGAYTLDNTFIVPDLRGPPRRFGSSLAISENEDVIVIGTPDTGSYGTAYVYEKSETGWNTPIELRRGDGGRGYGSEVAISDGFIYASSYSDLGVVDAYQKENDTYKLKARFMGDETKKGLGTNIAADNGHLIASYSSTKDASFNIYKALPESVELSQSVALLTPPVNRFSIFNLQEDTQGKLQAFKIDDIPAESAAGLSTLALNDGSALFSAYSESSHKLFKWAGASANGLNQIDIPQPSSVSDSAQVVGSWLNSDSLVYLINQYSDTQKRVTKITPSNDFAEPELIFDSPASVPSSLAVLNGNTYFLKGGDAGCSIHALMSSDTPTLSNVGCLPLQPLPNGWFVKRNNTYRYLSQESITGAFEFTVEVKNQSQLVTPMKVEVEVQ